MNGSLTAIFATALTLALVGTPVARRAAVRFGVLDLPARRKVHARPTPLLGGLALVVAVLGALLVYPDRRELVELGGILAGAAWISFWGLWDDRWGMRPSAKLAAQLVPAVLLLVGGVRVQLGLPEPLNVALTLVWILGVTNAFNLLDNMDGVAGGVGAVASGWFLFLAASNGQVLVASLSAALLGGCLGFLLHNFNPARIFLGDSGSLFLGFVLAAVGIKLRFSANDAAVTWMVPVLVLGVAILDTTFVVVRRLRAGRNPLTTPGRDHLAHRLTQRGWSARGAMLLLTATGLILGGAAALVSVSGPFVAYATAAGAAIGALALCARRG